ncbi:hypothetical protein Tco_0730158 [Tanacetum coccineum]|uniref:Tf2-1-like SH3-like domain-containing protein n=1 Tax=Tanacetum coccineum TaxID=301880 RepID=A0ABQ4YTS3_9ASTR
MLMTPNVDEGPNAVVAFMANLSSTSATNNPVNEVHSNDNQIFDNVDYQLSQEMHQEEHLDSDMRTEMMDNTIPTTCNVEPMKMFGNRDLKNELSAMSKQEIWRPNTHKVKLDRENKVRQTSQSELSRDQVYGLSANEIARQASKSAQILLLLFVQKVRPPSQVTAKSPKFIACFHPNLKVKRTTVLADSICLKDDTTKPLTSHDNCRSFLSSVRSPVCLGRDWRSSNHRSEIVSKTTEKVITIKQRFKPLAPQKSYTDLKSKPMEFQVGDRVMLKVLPWKGVVRFGKRGKLNPRYAGPFKVLAKVGAIAYKLELPQELSRVHNTFHVSNLKKCYSDEPLAIPLDGLHIDDKLRFVEEHVEVIDREVKRLKQSCIPIFKVRWNSRRGAELTWEREDQFQKKYPHLFTKRLPSCIIASIRHHLRLQEPDSPLSPAHRIHRLTSCPEIQSSTASRQNYRLQKGCFSAAATPMTAAAVEQLIEARVSAALANHETLRNSTNGQGRTESHNSDTGIKRNLYHSAVV